jgi:hypothetical protein
MCGGMLGAMVSRIAPARGDGAHCPSTARQSALHEQIFKRMGSCFLHKFGTDRGEAGTISQIPKFSF